MFDDGFSVSRGLVVISSIGVVGLVVVGIEVWSFKEGFKGAEPSNVTLKIFFHSLRLFGGWLKFFFSLIWDLTFLSRWFASLWWLSGPRKHSRLFSLIEAIIPGGLGCRSTWWWLYWLVWSRIACVWSSVWRWSFRLVLGLFSVYHFVPIFLFRFSFKPGLIGLRFDLCVISIFFCIIIF